MSKLIAYLKAPRLLQRDDFLDLCHDDRMESLRNAVMHGRANDHLIVMGYQHSCKNGHLQPVIYFDGLEKHNKTLQIEREDAFMDAVHHGQIGVIRHMIEHHPKTFEHAMRANKVLRKALASRGYETINLILDHLFKKRDSEAIERIQTDANFTCPIVCVVHQVNEYVSDKNELRLSYLLNVQQEIPFEQLFELMKVTRNPFQQLSLLMRAGSTYEYSRLLGQATNNTKMKLSQFVKNLT